MRWKAPKQTCHPYLYSQVNTPEMFFKNKQASVFPAQHQSCDLLTNPFMCLHCILVPWGCCQDRNWFLSVSTFHLFLYDCRTWESWQKLLPLFDLGGLTAKPLTPRRKDNNLYMFCCRTSTKRRYPFWICSVSCYNRIKDNTPKINEA